jgi:hypothetical protein
VEFKISEVDANPFRHIDRYPVREDKIQALRESIRSTSFWDNIVARVVDGRAQIAYGHHRLEALRREYNGDFKINLIVRELPDDMMLKIMANENMNEWGSSATVEHETIRAVVHAYAEGRIELAVPGAKTPQLRRAPSFVIGHVPADVGNIKAYTAQTVADFLGWTESTGRPQRRVSDGLAALELIESGTLTEASFVDLTSYQASAVVQQARKAKADSEARAKLEQQRAEKQAQAAEAARKSHEEAEARRAEAARQAAAARDEAEQRRHQREAEDQRRQAAEAQKLQREAERQRDTATAREQQHRAQAKKDASVVGGDVGAAFRSEKTTYKTAFKAAARTAPEKAPVMIDTYVSQVAARIHRLFEPDYHELAQKLDELIRFRDNISPDRRLYLSRELTSLAARVEQYRARLSSEAGESPDRAPDIEILDAEVVEESTMKEITG